MNTNNFIINEIIKPKNEKQLTTELEIIKYKKPENDKVKLSKWITEINKNNKFELLGIKRIEKNKNGGKYEVRINSEEENDIKMTTNNKDNQLFNYEKVKLDEKNGGNKNNFCDGCFIY